MTDRYAETRSLVALDIERWSSRNTIEQGNLQDDLWMLVDDALVVAGIEPSLLRRQHRGDGLLLSCPADLDKRLLTQPLVHALDERVRRHLFEAPAGRRMRLRVALHSGDIVDSGPDWQGPAVVEVCRLLDADELRRTLAEARTSVLAVVLSAHWYDEVVKAGRVPAQGYRQVLVKGKDGDRRAWIRVPGLNEPPGLEPIRAARDAQEAAGAPGGRSTRIKIGKVHSYTHVEGDNYTF
jgi:hypothetical protein